MRRLEVLFVRLRVTSWIESWPTAGDHPPNHTKIHKEQNFVFIPRTGNLARLLYIFGDTTLADERSFVGFRAAVLRKLNDECSGGEY